MRVVAGLLPFLRVALLPFAVTAAVIHHEDTKKHEVFALKGLHIIAQGNALGYGCALKTITTLKGRDNFKTTICEIMIYPPIDLILQFVSVFYGGKSPKA